MKRQTALQWLLEQWPILESQLPPYIINQALEMEREQIYNAWNDGCSEGIEGGQSTNCEEYFKETYGGQNEN
jgi:chemotaxis methyl-accepting protein methylase